MNKRRYKICNRESDRNLHKVTDMFDISELRIEENESVPLGDSSWDPAHCFGLIQARERCLYTMISLISQVIHR